MAPQIMAGCFSLDGRRPGRDLVERMVHPFDTAGDKPVTWVCGDVAFAITSEETKSVSPASANIGHDGFGIAVTGKIDNKQELAQRFGAPPFRSNIECILYCYRKVGEKCPSLLLGDFAFVIWDPVRRLLFGARDHIGVQPFFYAASSQTFVFSSALSQIPVGLRGESNEGVLADFLTGRVTDDSSTFFAGVNRLPPAHSFRVSRQGLCIRRYWELRASSAPDGDRAEQFRSRFYDAVAARLPSDQTPGLLLSGGLDSSSISCVARRLWSGPALPTFSSVSRTTDGRTERPFMEAVLAQGGFEPTIVPDEHPDPFDGLETIFGEQGGPVLAPNIASMNPLYAAARQKGVTLLLDGHGGDEVVSHGFARLSDLAREQRWLRLWRELAVAKPYGLKRSSLLANLLHHPGGHARAARLLQVLVGKETPPLLTYGDFIDPDLARRVALTDRLSQLERQRRLSVSNGNDAHIRSLTSPMHSYALEVLHRRSAAFGIELRFPFLDRRLVEFCVSLPAEEKLSGGWSRLILRRAMEGILPPSIQWRRDKHDFGPAILTAMLGRHEETLREVLRPSGPLSAYVQLSVIHKLLEQVRHAPETCDGVSMQALWRIAALGLWLRQSASDFRLEQQDRMKVA